MSKKDPEGRKLRILVTANGHDANAYSLPDGTIIMTWALISVLKGDADTPGDIGELVTVLLHERNHFIYKHHELLTTLRSGGKTMQEWVKNILNTEGLRRLFEAEADLRDLDILVDLGFDPRIHLRNLAQRLKHYGEGSEIEHVHGSWDARIAMIEAHFSAVNYAAKIDNARNSGIFFVAQPIPEAWVAHNIYPDVSVMLRALPWGQEWRHLVDDSTTLDGTRYRKMYRELLDDLLTTNNFYRWDMNKASKNGLLQKIDFLLGIIFQDYQIALQDYPFQHDYIPILLFNEFFPGIGKKSAEHLNQLFSSYQNIVHDPKKTDNLAALTNIDRAGREWVKLGINADTSRRLRNVLVLDENFSSHGEYFKYSDLQNKLGLPRWGDVIFLSNSDSAAEQLLESVFEGGYPPELLFGISRSALNESFFSSLYTSIDTIFQTLSDKQPDERAKAIRKQFLSAIRKYLFNFEDEYKDEDHKPSTQLLGNFYDLLVKELIRQRDVLGVQYTRGELTGFLGWTGGSSGFLSEIRAKLIPLAEAPDSRVLAIVRTRDESALALWLTEKEDVINGDLRIAYESEVLTQADQHWIASVILTNDIPSPSDKSYFPNIFGLRGNELGNQFFYKYKYDEEAHSIDPETKADLASLHVRMQLLQKTTLNLSPIERTALMINLVDTFYKDRLSSLTNIVSLSALLGGLHYTTMNIDTTIFVLGLDKNEWERTYGKIELLASEKQEVADTILSSHVALVYKENLISYMREHPDDSLAVVQVVIDTETELFQVPRLQNDKIALLGYTALSGKYMEPFAASLIDLMLNTITGSSTRVSMQQLYDFTAYIPDVNQKNAFQKHIVQRALNELSVADAIEFLRYVYSKRFFVDLSLIDNFIERRLNLKEDIDQLRDSIQGLAADVRSSGRLELTGVAYVDAFLGNIQEPEKKLELLKLVTSGGERDKELRAFLAPYWQEYVAVAAEGLGYTLKKIDNGNISVVGLGANNFLSFNASLERLYALSDLQKAYLLGKLLLENGILANPTTKKELIEHLSSLINTRDGSDKLGIFLQEAIRSLIQTGSGQPVVDYSLIQLVLPNTLIPPSHVDNSLAVSSREIDPTYGGDEDRHFYQSVNDNNYPSDRSSSSNNSFGSSGYKSFKGLDEGARAKIFDYTQGEGLEEFTTYRQGLDRVESSFVGKGSIEGQPIAQNSKKALSGLINPIDAVLRIAQSSGVGVRFLQVLGYHMDLAKDIARRFRDVYDQSPSQSKMVVYNNLLDLAVIYPDVKDFVDNRLVSISGPPRGGSLVTVYDIEVRLDNGQIVPAVMKVLNSNVEDYIGRLLQVVRDATADLAVRGVGYEKELAIASKLMDLIEAWMRADINDEEYLTIEPSFRSIHDNVPTANDSVIRTTTFLAPHNKYIKVELKVKDTTINDLMRDKQPSKTKQLGIQKAVQSAVESFYRMLTLKPIDRLAFLPEDEIMTASGDRKKVPRKGTVKVFDDNDNFLYEHDLKDLFAIQTHLLLPLKGKAVFSDTQESYEALLSDKGNRSHGEPRYIMHPDIHPGNEMTLVDGSQMTWIDESFFQLLSGHEAQLLMNIAGKGRLKIPFINSIPQVQQAVRFYEIVRGFITIHNDGLTQNERHKRIDPNNFLKDFIQIYVKQMGWRKFISYISGPDAQEAVTNDLMRRFREEGLRIPLSVEIGVKNIQALNRMLKDSGLSEVGEYTDAYQKGSTSFKIFVQRELINKRITVQLDNCRPVGSLFVTPVFAAGEGGGGCQSSILRLLARAPVQAARQIIAFWMTHRRLPTRAELPQAFPSRGDAQEVQSAPSSGAAVGQAAHDLQTAILPNLAAYQQSNPDFVLENVTRADVEAMVGKEEADKIFGRAPPAGMTREVFESSVLSSLADTLRSQPGRPTPNSSISQRIKEELYFVRLLLRGKNVFELPLIVFDRLWTTDNLSGYEASRIKAVSMLTQERVVTIEQRAKELVERIIITGEMRSAHPTFFETYLWEELQKNIFSGYTKPRDIPRQTIQRVATALLKRAIVEKESREKFETFSAAEPEEANKIRVVSEKLVNIWNSIKTKSNAELLRDGFTWIDIAAARYVQAWSEWPQLHHRRLFQRDDPDSNMRIIAGVLLRRREENVALMPYIENAGRAHQSVLKQYLDLTLTDPVIHTPDHLRILLMNEEEHAAVGGVTYGHFDPFNGGVIAVSPAHYLTGQNVAMQAVVLHEFTHSVVGNYVIDELEQQLDKWHVNINEGATAFVEAKMAEALGIPFEETSAHKSYRFWYQQYKGIGDVLMKRSGLTRREVDGELIWAQQYGYGNLAQRVGGWRALKNFFTSLPVDMSELQEALGGGGGGSIDSQNQTVYQQLIDALVGEIRRNPSLEPNSLIDIVVSGNPVYRQLLGIGENGDRAPPETKEGKFYEVLAQDIQTLKTQLSPATNPPTQSFMQRIRNKLMSPISEKTFIRESWLGLIAGTVFISDWARWNSHTPFISNILNSGVPYQTEGVAGFFDQYVGDAFPTILLTIVARIPVEIGARILEATTGYKLSPRVKLYSSLALGMAWPSLGELSLVPFPGTRSPMDLFGVGVAAASVIAGNEIGNFFANNLAIGQRINTSIANFLYDDMFDEHFWNAKIESLQNYVYQKLPESWKKDFQWLEQPAPQVPAAPESVKIPQPFSLTADNFTFTGIPQSVTYRLTDSATNHILPLPVPLHTPMTHQNILDAIAADMGTKSLVAPSGTVTITFYDGTGTLQNINGSFQSVVSETRSESSSKTQPPEGTGGGGGGSWWDNIRFAVEDWWNSVRRRFKRVTEDDIAGLVGPVLFDLTQKGGGQITADCTSGQCYKMAGVLVVGAKSRGLVATSYQVEDINEARGIDPQGTFGYTIVVVYDEEGAPAYLLDPTFAQNIWPTTNEIRQIAVETGIYLSDPEAAVARELLAKGYIPLTQESLAAYLRLTIGKQHVVQAKSFSLGELANVASDDFIGTTGSTFFTYEYLRDEYKDMEAAYVRSLRTNPLAAFATGEEYLDGQIEAGNLTADDATILSDLLAFGNTVAATLQKQAEAPVPTEALVELVFADSSMQSQMMKLLADRAPPGSPIQQTLLDYLHVALSIEFRLPQSSAPSSVNTAPLLPAATGGGGRDSVGEAEFDPEIALDAILKAPTAQRRTRLDTYLEQLVFQRQALASLREYLYGEIEKNSDLDTNLLITEIQTRARASGLSEIQIQKLFSFVTLYDQKRSRVSELVGEYPDPAKLLEAAFGIKPFGKVQMKRANNLIVFEIGGIDMARGFGKPSGFFISGAAPKGSTHIPDAKNIFIIKNTGLGSFFLSSEKVIRHEARHQLNAMWEALDSYGNSLIRNSEALKAETQRSRTTDQISIEEYEVLVKQYLFDYRQFGEKSAANEIIAQIAGETRGKIGIFRRLEILIDLNVSSFYYFTTHDEDVKLILTRFVPVDLITNMPDARYASILQRALDQYYSESEQWRLESQALSAYNTLLDKGYSQEEAFAILDSIRMTYWQKNADRMPVKIGSGEGLGGGGEPVVSGRIDQGSVQPTRADRPFQSGIIRGYISRFQKAFPFFTKYRAYRDNEIAFREKVKKVLTSDGYIALSARVDAITAEIRRGAGECIVSGPFVPRVYAAEGAGGGGTCPWYLRAPARVLGDRYNLYHEFQVGAGDGGNAAAPTPLDTLRWFTLPVEDCEMLRLGNRRNNSLLIQRRIAACDLEDRQATLAPPASTVSFRSDHVTMVNGKPFFPIGIFYLPGPESEASWKKVNDGHFNTVSAWWMGEQQIDRAEKYGIYYVGYLNYAFPGFARNCESPTLQNDSKLTRYRSSPYLLAWYGVDEPNVSKNPCVSFHDWLWQNDPDHPLWTNYLDDPKRTAFYDEHGYSGYTSYADFQREWNAKTHTSVSGFDPGDMALLQNTDQYGNVVRKYVEDLGRNGNGTQATWVILPAHSEVPRTYQSFRYQAYEAVVNGATGLYWWDWAYSCTRETCPGFGWNGGSANAYKTHWDNLTNVTGELTDMTPGLVGETVEEELEGSVAYRIKEGTDEKMYVFAVSQEQSGERPPPWQATIQGLPAGVTFTVVGENRTVTTNAQGNIIDFYGPMDTHVYVEEK